MGIALKWGPDGSFTAPVARGEEKYVSNRSENWVFIPFSLGLPSLEKHIENLLLKHQLKLIEVFLMPQTYPGVTSTSSMAVNTTLCAMIRDKYFMSNSWHDKARKISCRGEKMFAFLFTHRDVRWWSKCGSSATCGTRTCCSPPLQGSPGVWKSDPTSHKNSQTTHFTFAGRLAGGWQLTTKHIPSWWHSWGLSNWGRLTIFTPPRVFQCRKHKKPFFFILQDMYNMPCVLISQPCSLSSVCTIKIIW